MRSSNSNCREGQAESTQPIFLVVAVPDEEASVVGFDFCYLWNQSLLIACDQAIERVTVTKEAIYISRQPPDLWQADVYRVNQHDTTPVLFTPLPAPQVKNVFCERSDYGSFIPSNHYNLHSPMIQSNSRHNHVRAIAQ